MEERTLVNATSPTTAGRSFLFREDYLLFGLLVRHGLVAPEDHDPLVQAQRAEPQRRTLAVLLAETSRLTPKSRADIDELLRVLANPELRKLLPGELPELKTLVQLHQEPTVVGRSEATVRDDLSATEVAPGAPPRQKGSSETQVLRPSAPTLSSTRMAGGVTLSATYLTQDEQSRVDAARSKGGLIGTTLNNHILLDRLGSGGQGDVYLAKQVSLNRYVALKKLEVPSYAEPQRFIDTFQQEAQTLARINHARIVKVFEIFLQDGTAFFTMEYLQGKTLKELVTAAKGPMPLDVVANLACQACSALGRTAEDGLVHRDIKPANMMVDENGDLKIVDFGLAGAAASFKSPEGFSGTPQFAAPEQIKQEALTPASDQYSLGVTLYFVLTGELPFKASKIQDLLDLHLTAKATPPSEINTALPRSVDRVILRMMEKNPGDRFASFDECFTEWERILQESARQSVVGSRQLLGESLLRFSRQERNAIIQRSAVLVGAWIAVVVGTLLGEAALRRAGYGTVLDWCGNFGTYLLCFSLFCIFYVAAARRHFLPVMGSLRTWLYVHIATAIPSVVLLLVHSGNFLRNAMPGPPDSKPILSIIVAAVLLITAVSGSVGLVIFRALRRQLQIQQLALRGTAMGAREAMLTVLGAELLSGWRLVHYPLALFFMLLSIVHIFQALRFSMP